MSRAVAHREADWKVGRCGTVADDCRDAQALAAFLDLHYAPRRDCFFLQTIGQAKQCKTLIKDTDS